MPADILNWLSLISKSLRTSGFHALSQKLWEWKPRWDTWFFNDGGL